MCTHRRGVAWKINWRKHTTSGVSFIFNSLFFFFFFNSSASSPTFTCISRFFSCWYNARNSSKIYIVFSLSPSKRSNFQFLIHFAGLLWRFQLTFSSFQIFHFRNWTFFFIWHVYTDFLLKNHEISSDKFMSPCQKSTTTTNAAQCSTNLIL